MVFIWQVTCCTTSKLIWSVMLINHYIPWFPNLLPSLCPFIIVLPCAFQKNGDSLQSCCHLICYLNTVVYTISCLNHNRNSRKNKSLFYCLTDSRIYMKWATSPSNWPTIWLKPTPCLLSSARRSESSLRFPSASHDGGKKRSRLKGRV